MVGRTLKVFVRKATAAETRRAEASEALREAEAGTDYAFLHGRIVAARARGVDQRRLEAAQARLKTLQPDTASKDELVSTLKWDRDGQRGELATGLQTGEKVCSLPGCTVGEPIEGEVLSFVPTAAQQALKGLFADKSKGIDQSVSPDRWLFERIAEAAAAAANEGGVWRSGGKFILSAITRNQSPTALHRYLLSIGQKMCAEGIDALVKWTEATYNHHVSAIQINVHIDSTCFPRAAQGHLRIGAERHGGSGLHVLLQAEHRDRVPELRLDKKVLGRGGDGRLLDAVKLLRLLRGLFVPSLATIGLANVL